MTDQRNAFEIRLASLFDRYAAAAPVEVDASALARIIAARDSPVIEVFGRTFVKPPWLVPALGTLMLLLALAAAVFIGAQLMRHELVVPEHHLSGVLRPINGAGGVVLPLRDGTLFTTGQTPNGGPDTYRIVNVETGEVRYVGRSLTSRQLPGLVELQDGRVLVLGADYKSFGDGNSMPSTTVTAEIFDPATGQAKSAGNLLVSRYRPTVVPLRDGRVLIAGGAIAPDGLVPIASAEIFDPATGASTATGSLTEPRFRAPAIELPDGQILFIGTATGDMLGTQTAEIFDPASSTFHAIEGPRDPRFGQAVRVRGGRVLLVHGSCHETPTMLSEGLSDTALPAPAELYDPSLPGFVEAPDLPHCIFNIVGLPDGRAFVSGFYYKERARGGNDQVAWSGVYDPDDGNVQEIVGPLGYLARAVGMPDGRVVFWPGQFAWGDILE